MPEPSQPLAASLLSAVSLLLVANPLRLPPLAVNPRQPRPPLHLQPQASLSPNRSSKAPGRRLLLAGPLSRLPVFLFPHPL